MSVVVLPQVVVTLGVRVVGDEHLAPDEDHVHAHADERRPDAPAPVVLDAFLVELGAVEKVPGLVLEADEGGAIQDVVGAEHVPPDVNEDAAEDHRDGRQEHPMGGRDNGDLEERLEAQRRGVLQPRDEAVDDPHDEALKDGQETDEEKEDDDDVAASVVVSTRLFFKEGSSFVIVLLLSSSEMARLLFNAANICLLVSVYISS